MTDQVRVAVVMTSRSSRTYIVRHVVGAYCTVMSNDVNIIRIACNFTVMQTVLATAQSQVCLIDF